MLKHTGLEGKIEKYIQVFKLASIYIILEKRRFLVSMNCNKHAENLRFSFFLSCRLITTNK